MDFIRAKKLRYLVIIVIRNFQIDTWYMNQWNRTYIWHILLNNLELFRVSSTYWTKLWHKKIFEMIVKLEIYCETWCKSCFIITDICLFHSIHKLYQYIFHVMTYNIYGHVKDVAMNAVILSLYPRQIIIFRTKFMQLI